MTGRFRILAVPLALVGSCLAGSESIAQEADPVDLPPAVDLGAAYTADIWANVSGGRRRGVRYLDNLDLTAEIDAERVVGLAGVTLYGHLLYNNGNSISDLVGDAQTLSNIETGVRAVRLFEAWADVPLSETGSLRFGLYDLNSEFDAINASGLFLNSSHGIGAEFAATGANGPSIFPVTSLAVRYQQALSSTLTFRVAALDAVPGNPDRPRRTVVRLSPREGALLVGEIEYSAGALRAVAGHWHYTRLQDQISGTGTARSRGFYALAETRLAGSELPDASRLDGFVRAGFASPSVNPVETYVGVGLNWQRPFGLTDDHALGLALAWSEFGRPLRRIEEIGRREIAIELTYLHAISENLSLQPDLQWIVSPGGDPHLRDALVAGLRVVLSL